MFKAHSKNIWINIIWGNQNMAEKKEQIVLGLKDLERINKIISDMRYGSVTLIIQDGVLLQIEKNEKIRLK